MKFDAAVKLGEVRFGGYVLKRRTGKAEMPIPYQAAHVTGRPARGAEGLTHRGCGNNNPSTSAQHRRNSVKRYAELTGNRNRKTRGIKSPRREQSLIDTSVWGFWQNTVKSFATEALTAGTATMQTMMNRTWLSQARGPDKPDLWIADNTYFRYYWESLQAIQRIQDDRAAMAGFMNLKFMTADVVYDGGFQGNATGNVSVLGSGGSWLSGSGAPASHMYALNSDYLFLRPFEGREFQPLDPDRYSVNQDALVKLVAWAGNMAMSNRFLQGVITA